MQLILAKKELEVLALITPHTAMVKLLWGSLVAHRHRSMGYPLTCYLDIIHLWATIYDKDNYKLYIMCKWATYLYLLRQYHTKPEFISLGKTINNRILKI